MNDTLKRIKLLAGISESAAVIVEQNPIVNIETYVNFSQEIDFHKAAKAFGASTSSINDVSGRTVGWASFKGAEANNLAEAFINAWRSGVTTLGVVNEEEANVDACPIEAPCENNEAQSQEESTETIEIVEVSKKVLGSYIKKATSQTDDRSVLNLASTGGYKLAKNEDADDDGHAEDSKAVKRAASIAKAVDKITKEEDLSAVKEGYQVVKGIDKEKYQEREGLEGPFAYKNGKVYYYDKKEGKDYDPDSDRYIENSDRDAMNESELEGPFTFKNGREYYYVTNESAEFGTWSTITLGKSLTESAGSTEWLLYVGNKGKNKSVLCLEFTGDSSDSCLKEFKNNYMTSYDEKTYQIVESKLNVQVPSTVTIVTEAKEAVASEDVKATPDKHDLTIKGASGVEVKTPASLKIAVANRIKELNAAIEEYDEKGFDDVSQKQKAIDCLNQIMDNLSSDTLDGVKQAQIFYGTLMSPIYELFPAQLLKYLTAPTYGYDTKSGWLDKFK